MKRAGFSSRGKPLQAKTRIKPKSAKKSAHRASSDGQAALAYMGAVKALPCAVCGKAGPSDAHHVFNGRYGSAKASDWDVIPLCKAHHQDGPGAIHNIKRTWRERHGPDYGFIPSTARLVFLRFGTINPLHPLPDDV